MKTSETTNKFWPAFLSAQKLITFAVKDSKNPHFNSRYADLGSVIDSVKPALNENGIAIIQSIGTFTSGVMEFTTRLVHECGEWIEETMQIPLTKSDAQGVGSATTYARRYQLASLTGLYQDDDDGNAASGNKSAPRSEPSTKPSGNYAKDTKNAEAKKEEPKKDDKPKTETKGPTGKTVKVLEIPLPKDGRDLDNRVSAKLNVLVANNPSIVDEFAEFEKSYFEDLEPDQCKKVDDFERKDIENYYRMYMKFLHEKGIAPKEYKLV